MYRRVLLKISGETMTGSSGRCLEEPSVINVAENISDLKNRNPEIQIAVVIGGGNIFRGKENPYIERVKADYIGSLATVLNALALGSALDGMGVESVVMTPFDLKRFSMDYNAFEGRKVLEEKKVLVLGGGTGHPFFSTDTNAALRAAELECDLIIKATKVNGLYDKDPVKNPDAVFISDISFDAVIKNGYNVMDITAFTLCRDNNIPIYICNFFEQGTVTGFLNGEKKGSIIR